MSSVNFCNFSAAFCEELLGWYVKHRRSLPWRATSIEKRNPYHTWLSEIMLQQTTVPTVIPYFLKFIDLYPDITDLAAAPEEDILRHWAGLGYYARARNLIKCAKVVVKDYNGVFPDNLEALKKLPGIGEYTAAAIRTIAFDKPANVIDGNVERVVSRIFKIEEPLPQAKPLIKQRAAALMEALGQDYGDYAQGLMDLGATICTPAKPKCEICLVSKYCHAYKTREPETYPKKQPKKPKPKRYGHIYWLEDNEGYVLFDRREEKGLLGGMVGLPTNEWQVDAIEATSKHFANIKFKPLPEKVKHVFTHFELELSLYKTKLPKLLDFETESRYFIEKKQAGVDLGLPTVFKKAYNILKD